MKKKNWSNSYSLTSSVAQQTWRWQQYTPLNLWNRRLVYVMNFIRNSHKFCPNHGRREKRAHFSATRSRFDRFRVNPFSDRIGSFRRQVVCFSSSTSFSVDAKRTEHRSTQNARIPKRSSSNCPTCVKRVCFGARAVGIQIAICIRIHYERKPRISTGKLRLHTNI